MRQLLRPYDLQISREWPNDDQIDEWLSSLEGPCVNILVGPRKCGKSTFIASHGLQVRGSKHDRRSAVDPTIEINTIDSNRWRASNIKDGIRREESFIFDSTNLTALERKRILRMFPNSYYKVIITWELSDEELKLRGCSSSQIEEAKKNYDRPNAEEEVDELVYIFS